MFTNADKFDVIVVEFMLTYTFGLILKWGIHSKLELARRYEMDMNMSLIDVPIKD